MISLDTETTGIDLHHGAKPFFVTTCNEKGEQKYWEWDVDPMTREPQTEDYEEIEETLNGTDYLVLQNAKFDFAALATVLPSLPNWGYVHDTLIAGHLLASNQPHDLTSMTMHYLGVDIEPYEKALERAVRECRIIVRRETLNWAIAESGRGDMPSAKEKTWKYDSWLPRALAKVLDYPKDHEWYTVLSNYSNADSAVTIALWKVMEVALKKRDLWEIYLERLKVIPIAFAMEQRGITLSKSRLDQLTEEYKEESEEAGNLCRGIADSYNYPLTLPKSGNNKSLTEFVFNPNLLNCPRLKVSDKTGAPSLDRATLETYESILPENSKALSFIKAIKGKRKRDTALSYMESYCRFWIPMSNGLFIDSELEDWYVLHPSLNPTGTDTLRWSSSNPNEQNIPKQEGFNLRYCFGPAPGREWWSLDAKNIELRIPAYESGETAFIELFERPDDPPYFGSNHLLISHLLHKEKFEECINDDKSSPHYSKVDGRIFKKKYASTLYQRIKNGNFAVQYGAVDKEDGTGKADRTYGVPGAQARIASKFSKQAALNEYWIDYANRYGYVETMPDKTVNPKRGYPLLCTRTDYGRAKPTIPFNYHVQGTAMQWMGKAMTRCFSYLRALTCHGGEKVGGYHIALQVHDELVFDFPRGSGPEPWKSNLPKVRKLQRLMEEGGGRYRGAYASVDRVSRGELE